jgi:hypothetical protein
MRQEPACLQCGLPLRRTYFLGRAVYGYTGTPPYSRFTQSGSPFCSLRCGHTYAWWVVHVMEVAKLAEANG